MKITFSQILETQNVTFKKAELEESVFQNSQLINIFFEFLSNKFEIY